MKTLIGCIVLGYLLFQFGHTLDRLSTDAIGMMIGLGFGALAMLGIPLLLIASNRRHPSPPNIIERPRYEIVEDRTGRLYEYDTFTGTMELIANNQTRIKRIA